MRSRSSLTPAGTPVTMIVSCGPCDSPAARKVKEAMGTGASRACDVQIPLLGGIRAGLRAGASLPSTCLDPIRFSEDLYEEDGWVVGDPLFMRRVSAACGQWSVDQR